MKSIKKVEALLQQAQRPLVMAHSAPDGDAIGSLLGLGWALRAVGKWPTLACADPVPENLAFLPGSGEIVRQSRGDEDLIVTLDSADLERLGSLYDEARFQSLPVLNIDHHITNVGFGCARLIDPGAASTAQLVHALLRQLGWPIAPWTATCLLTGLITDTRSFSTSNTDAEALRTAVALVEAGAPLAEINAELNRNLSLGALALWGQVLSNLQTQAGIVWAEVSYELQRRCGLGDPCANGTSGLVSFLASAREAQIAALLTEKADGSVEVSLRSVPGIDVSAVALALGGGGHRQAAGCALPGPLAAAREALLQRLASLLPPPTTKPLGDSNVARSLSVSS